MSKSLSFASRSGAIIAAAVLAVAGLAPAVLLGRADAAQVTTRSIQLSNSATGATSVSYRVQFDVPTTGTNVEGIVIDICSGNTSPLIGTACSAPTNFSWQAVPTVVTATIGGVDVSGWTFGTQNGNRTLTLLDSVGTGEAITATETVVIEISGVANPSDVDVVTGGDQVGTFYGRAITFSDDTQIASYDPTNGDSTTGYIDSGGFAMSTTTNLTVTARVQESLTFCIYTNTPQTSCASATNAGVNIPDATTPLSTSSVSTASAYFGLATNALNGANVRMWSNNGSDGVLKSGTYTITAFGPVDDTQCTADSVTTSVEQFGMRIVESASVTPAATYDCAAGNHGWDADAGGDDATTVGSAFGDSIATTAGPLDFEENQMEFAAKSALTTEAGIYSSVLNYIATATY